MDPDIDRTGSSSSSAGGSSNDSTPASEAPPKMAVGPSSRERGSAGPSGERQMHETASTTSGDDWEAGLGAMAAVHKTQGAFVPKLYMMVQSPAIPLIAWSDDGTRFAVSNPIEFSKILPHFFKHNNFQSFVRQLNIYSFSKVHHSASTSSSLLSHSSGDGPWEFEHPSFQRDRPELLPSVKRKTKTPHQGLKPQLSDRPLKSAAAPRRPSPSELSVDSSLPSPNARDREELPEPPHQAYSSAPSPLRPSWAPRERPPLDYYHDSEPASPWFESEDPRSAPPPSLRPMSRSAPHQSNSPPPSQGGSLSDRPLQRQLAGLDYQVAQLTEALYHTRQETVTERMATAAVMKLLLNVISNLDSRGERRDEINAAAAAVAQLSQSPPAQHTATFPPGFTSPHPSYWENPGKPPKSSHHYPSSHFAAEHAESNARDLPPPDPPRSPETFGYSAPPTAASAGSSRGYYAPSTSILPHTAERPSSSRDESTRSVSGSYQNGASKTLTKKRSWNGTEVGSGSAGGAKSGFSLPPLSSMLPGAGSSADDWLKRQRR